MPFTLMRMPQLLLLVAFFLYRPPLSLAGLARESFAAVIKQKNIADTTIANCSKAEQVEKIITEAISIGAPVYNSGYHLACYRIYEWAGYKILYEYGDSCTTVKKIMKAAIEKSHGDYSDLEKAWIMRTAFDKIMGVPTQTADPAKKTETERKG